MSGDPGRARNDAGTDPAPTNRHSRGKTRPGRLRLIDRWLCLHASPRHGEVIDLGLGALPWTTIELAHALRDNGSDAQVIGLDQDPARVTAALPYAEPRLSFAQGGFTLAGHDPQLVRAFNLLRQYPIDDTARAISTMLAHLDPGGMLIEGSSCRGGHTAAARLLYPAQPARDAMLLTSDLQRGFAPAMFRGVLPTGLRTDPRVRTMLTAWQRAFEATDPRSSLLVRAAESARPMAALQIDHAQPDAIALRWSPPPGTLRG